MRVQDNDSREFCATVSHYLASLVERRDYLGAVEYFECNRLLLEAIGGSEGGAALHQAAKACLSLADYPKALRIARRAQAMVAETGDNLLLAEIFVTVGEILRNLGESREAEKALRDAESIFRRNDSLEGQSRALNQLAGLFYRQSEYRNALSVLMDAVEIARKLSDKRKLAFMMGNIGRILTFIGDFDQAEKHLKVNLELSEELADGLEAGRAYMSLGYLYLQRAEYTQASQALEEAYRRIIVTNHKRDEAMCLTYIGELQYRMNVLGESQKTLTKALAIAETIDRSGTLAGRVLRHLGELHVRQNNYRTAQRCVARALAIYERTSDKVETGALWKLKGLIAEAAGHDDEGRACLIKAIELLSESDVKFEKADALAVAGNSRLFGVRERMTYLFRAEEWYTRCRIKPRADETARQLEKLGQMSPNPTYSATPKSAGADYITANESIKQFKAQLPMFGRADLSILLVGETGVGKDHLARYYHSVVRPDGPYVAINCASLPETLLESELFGYCKGAFTGADRDKPGLFVTAHRGVLLLDEIGDMPMSLQGKLLGVLQERRVIPLGGTTEVGFDVKLVAATNKDLEAMVAAGTFRRDLYYRLSGHVYRIPSLRERKEDVPLLLAYFMTKRGLLSEGQRVPAELLRQFIDYDWPGNVRELDNTVKRLEVLAGMVAEGDLVELARSIFERGGAATKGTLFDRVEEFERQLIVEALLAANGNKCEAARLLGVHEATVRMKLKRYGVNPSHGAPN
ncbi:MAG TPA: sigma 54-interacting transcriptional regulator [Candidatus Acidoferrum sp.]|nr:sigma 54-interacting transcriptional regulator [Candidatus Acidoferrum sp.]